MSREVVDATSEQSTANPIPYVSDEIVNGRGRPVGTDRSPVPSAARLLDPLSLLVEHVSGNDGDEEAERAVREQVPGIE